MALSGNLEASLRSIYGHFLIWNLPQPCSFFSVSTSEKYLAFIAQSSLYDLRKQSSLKAIRL